MPKVKPKQTDGAVLQPRVKVSKRTVKKMSAEGPKKRQPRMGEPPNRSMSAKKRAMRAAKVRDSKVGQMNKNIRRQQGKRPR